MRNQSAIESFGITVTRYGLVVVLLLIGLAKFTHAEAQAIQPLIVHSPFMSWMYHLWAVDGVSRWIGAIEITLAVLISLRSLSPKLSLVGSVGGVITFLLTCSFLLSTPGAVQFKGISVLGDAGQFLIKDLVLLGASIYLAGDALAATRLRLQVSGNKVSSASGAR